MIIVVGLGNPGEKFKNTRHNIGFTVVDFFAKENNFPNFKLSKKYNSLISENDDVILAKPQMFMNNSGLAVKKIISNFKFKMQPSGVPAGPANLVVIHDDIDLLLGKIKFSKDSGSGGHKGVESVIDNLGKKDFIRLKIGIGNEGNKVKAEEIVLKKFTKSEMEIIDSVVEKTSDALIFFIENGLEKTMNEYNK